MREGGVEPPRVAPRDPKSRASADSAIPAADLSIAWSARGRARSPLRPTASTAILERVRPRPPHAPPASTWLCLPGLRQPAIFSPRAPSVRSVAIERALVSLPGCRACVPGRWSRAAGAPRVERHAIPGSHRAQRDGAGRGDPLADAAGVLLDADLALRGLLPVGCRPAAGLLADQGRARARLGQRAALRLGHGDEALAHVQPRRARGRALPALEPAQRHGLPALRQLPVGGALALRPPVLPLRRQDGADRGLVPQALRAGLPDLPVPAPDPRRARRCARRRHGLHVRGTQRAAADVPARRRAGRDPGRLPLRRARDPEARRGTALRLEPGRAGAGDPRRRARREPRAVLLRDAADRCVQPGAAGRHVDADAARAASAEASGAPGAGAAPVSAAGAGPGEHPDPALPRVPAAQHGLRPAQPRADAARPALLAAGDVPEHPRQPGQPVHPRLLDPAAELRARQHGAHQRLRLVPGAGRAAAGARQPLRALLLDRRRGLGGLRLRPVRRVEALPAAAHARPRADEPQPGRVAVLPGLPGGVDRRRAREAPGGARRARRCSSCSRPPCSSSCTASAPSA